MSVNPPSMTTHPSQSLPSFAQAFSNQSLSCISSATNALPPIQARISTMDRDNGRPQQRSPPTPSRSRPASEENVERTAGRKRPHNDIASGSREDERSDSDRASPALIRVKEENDQEMLNPSPSPPQRLSDNQRLLQPTLDAQGPGPSPSSATPAVKKRRMTITGAPHALNTDVRVPQDQANSTPISPVVMGFTIPRDNPKEVEQLKSMMTVKQKQKALIEQRRGSLAGGNSAPPAPAEDRASNSAKTSVPSISIRNTRRSPNGGAGTRRPPANASAQQGVQRPPSPNPGVFQSQQTTLPPHQSAHTLPAPPISFARRRAAQLGTKKKPADIVISPREQHSTEQFQPSIHSAPPTQSAFYSGKPSMALPRLPNVMGGGEVRRQPGNVPPTPTRLSQRMASSAIPPSITVSESTPRSPMASVPIASSLVPPTPAFNQSEFGGDKNAFLAPFNYFYDALNDAKQMKSWLGDQLQRSNALFKSLQQQQEKLNETVDTLVERKLSGVYSELTGLRRRVLELEDALHESRSGSRPSVDVSYHSKAPQNGYLAPDSYTFPPHPQRSDNSSGRVPSPRGHDTRGGGQHQSELEYETPSASYDARRGSLTAPRLDGPSRSHHHDGTALPPLMSTRISHPVHQERDNHSMHGKVSRANDREPERPSVSRQQSYTGSSQDRDRGRERDWDRELEHRGGDSPPPRRVEDSRRNSVIMSPPDHRMEDS